MAIAVVALVAMFVRPNSNGPALVEGIGNAFIQSVNATIGANVSSSSSSSSSGSSTPAPAAPTIPSTHATGTFFA